MCIETLLKQRHLDVIWKDEKTRATATSWGNAITVGLIGRKNVGCSQVAGWLTQGTLPLPQGKGSGWSLNLREVRSETSCEKVIFVEPSGLDAPVTTSQDLKQGDMSDLDFCAAPLMLTLGKALRQAQTAMSTGALVDISDLIIAVVADTDENEQHTTEKLLQLARIKKVPVVVLHNWRGSNSVPRATSHSELKEVLKVINTRGCRLMSFRRTLAEENRLLPRGSLKTHQYSFSKRAILFIWRFSKTLLKIVRTGIL